MNDLLRELIYEMIMLESNKPPRWIKKNRVLYYNPKKDNNKKFKKKIKKKIRVKIYEPDGPADRTIIIYKGKKYSVKSKSLTRVKK